MKTLLAKIIRELRDGTITVDIANQRLSFLDWRENFNQLVRDINFANQHGMDDYIRQYSRNPEDILIEKETIEEELLLIKHILSWLKPDEKELLWAFVVEGERQEDIAKRFGIKQAAVSRRVSRIIKKIRAKCNNLVPQFDTYEDVLNEVRRWPSPRQSPMINLKAS